MDELKKILELAERMIAVKKKLFFVHNCIGVGRISPKIWRTEILLTVDGLRIFYIPIFSTRMLFLSFILK